MGWKPLERTQNQEECFLLIFSVLGSYLGPESLWVACSSSLGGSCEPWGGPKIKRSDALDLWSSWGAPWRSVDLRMPRMSNVPALENSFGSLHVLRFCCLFGFQTKNAQKKGVPGTHLGTKDPIFFYKICNNLNF